VSLQESIGLLFTPIEDATVGLWLSALNLRHVGHRRFRTLGTPCCFEPAVRRDGDRVVSQFQLQVRCCAQLRASTAWPWRGLVGMQLPDYLLASGSFAGT